MSRGLAGQADIRFLPGIRQDVNKSDAPPGTLIDALNVRYGRQGGIRTRLGTVGLSTDAATVNGELASDTRDTAPGFATRVGGSQLMGKDGFVWSYNANAWLRQGAYSTAQPRRRRNGLATESGNGFAKPDTRCAIASMTVDLSGGYTFDLMMVAATDGTNVYWRIENFDGMVMREGAATGTVCNIVTQNPYFILVVQNGTDLSATVIEALNGQAPFINSAVSVGTLASSNAKWDASSYDEDCWFLVYGVSASDFRLSRREITTQNGSAVLAGFATGNAPCSVWGDPNAGLVWVGYYTDPTVTGAVGFRAYSDSVALVGSGTIVTGTNIYGPPLFGPVSSGSPGEAFFVHRRASTSSPYTWGTHYGMVTQSGTVTLGGVGSSYPPVWHVAPLTKPDRKQRVWCEVTDSVVSTNSDLGFRTSRHVLIRFPDDVNSVQFPSLELANDPMENAASGPGAYEFHAVAEASDRTFAALPLLVRSGNGLLFRSDVLEYETTEHVPQRLTRTLAQSTVVTGQPVELFGHPFPAFGSTSNWLSGSVEIGFPYEPAVFSAATSNGAGALTSGSTYEYVFVYEWIDQYGRRHQSGASKSVTVTTGASDDTVTFSLAGMSFGQRLAYSSVTVAGLVMPPVIHAYRTLANSSGPYRRATPDTGAPVAWDSFDGLVSWVDTLADSSLATQEILYTDGGVVNNALAPSARYVTVTDERVVVAGLWDTNVVRTSKIVVPGEPVLFTNSPAFDVILRGACTGIACQDGQIIAFERDAISAIFGDGPSDQGNGTFVARRVCSGRGCIDGRSILETSLGIIFQSQRGFELLPRGNGPPQFIGAPVQTMTGGGLYSECLASALYTSDTERLAMFLMRGADALGTRILCLDLDLTADLGYGVWSYDLSQGFTYSAIGEWPEGVACLLETPDTSAVIAGTVYDRTYTGGYDATNSYGFQSIVETADLRMAGLAGWWRCSSLTMLITDVNGGTLTARVSTDGGDSISQTTTTRALPPFTSRSVYQAVVPSRQQCTSAVLRMSTLVEGIGVTGPTYHGATMEFEPIPGARRTTSGER